MIFNPHVYLFERATGRLLARGAPLPADVNHLAFAPDGRRLAVGLGGANGLRIRDGASLAPLGEDPDYGDAIYGAAFAAHGRLATTSRDGKLRLYAPDLTRLAQVEAPGGKEPYAVAWAPDGKSLAVGYVDTTRVDVLDGRTLALRFAADSTGVDVGNLGRVAWSADGAFLFAAGRWTSGEPKRLRRWAGGGPGAFRDFALSRSTVMDLRPLPGGRLAFAAAEPALGVLGRDGEKLWQSPPAIADLLGQGDVVAIAADGARVAFGYQLLGKEPATFDLRVRRLLPGPADPALVKARTESLPVSNWKERTDPALAGRPLSLYAYEISRSLAIAADASRFLLGADWSLRLFDRDGKEIWRQPVPGAVWAVTMTPDARLAVAAYADGTIRWHRMSDGTELLAFFPHADKERWVLWTPAGYYMASPGGEELIGWQVNRGFDEAPEWYTAARFRDRFYRPDIIDLVLDTLDVSEAVRRAEAARPSPPETKAVSPAPATVAAAALAVLAGRPPIIVIREPVEDAEIADDELLVRYFVEAPPSAPAEQLKALLDGDNIMQLNLPPGTTARENRTFVPLSPLASQLVLLARNAHGWSDPATVRFRRPSAQPNFVEPTLHLLTIGVGVYRNHADLKLRFPADDAESVWRAWQGQAGGLYRDVIAQPLLDDDASASNILSGLKVAAEQMQQDDVAAVFFSGHGQRDSFGHLCLLPHEADGSNEIELQRSAVRFSNVEDWLGLLGGKGTTLVFLDACHAGAALPGAGTKPFDLDEAANRLAAPERGVYVFTACTGTQAAIEKPIWNHGAMTTALLEVFNGSASTDAEGCVTLNFLEDYLKDRVSELTDGAQTPRVLTPSTRKGNPRLFRPR